MRPDGATNDTAGGRVRKPGQSHTQLAALDVLDSDGDIRARTPRTHRSQGAQAPRRVGGTPGLPSVGSGCGGDSFARLSAGTSPRPPPTAKPRSIGESTAQIEMEPERHPLACDGASARAAVGSRRRESLPYSAAGRQPPRRSSPRPPILRQPMRQGQFMHGYLSGRRCPHALSDRRACRWHQSSHRAHRGCPMMANPRDASRPKRRDAEVRVTVAGSMISAEFTAGRGEPAPPTRVSRCPAPPLLHPDTAPGGDGSCDPARNAGSNRDIVSHSHLR